MYLILELSQWYLKGYGHVEFYFSVFIINNALGKHFLWSNEIKVIKKMQGPQLFVM